MGILDFLKKDKDTVARPEMDLPPLPEMSGVGNFPEPPQGGIPPLPEDTLPPLPQDSTNINNSNIPSFPSADQISMPARPTASGNTNNTHQIEDIPLPPMPGQPANSEQPEMADMPTPPGMFDSNNNPNMPTPNVPSMPEMIEHEVKRQEMGNGIPTVSSHPNDEFVPGKIPPLEGIPVQSHNQTQPITPLPDHLEKATPDTRQIGNQLDNVGDVLLSEMEINSPVYNSEPIVKNRKMIRGSVFVKADSIKETLISIDEMSTQFRSEDDLFGRINDVKERQDTKLEELRQSLEDMQRKLIFVDKTLFEKQY